MLNKEQRHLALYWYVHMNFDLQTIAQHFGLTQEQMKVELRNILD